MEPSTVNLKYLALIGISLILLSCTQTLTEEAVDSVETLEDVEVASVMETVTVTASAVPTSIIPAATEEVLPTETVAAQVTEEESFSLSYDDLPPTTEWESWPELPILSEEAIAIYKRGIQSGTDPHAFSVFGDCQSLPDDFWGRYDDPEYVLPSELAQYTDVIDWYSGSFDRESVTVKKGTTAAAILWAGWLDGDDHPCEYGESPLECELRIHNPSIIIISLGTHWELRNGQYLRKMLDQLIDRGVLPIISSKADHREGEAWVNEEMISIAYEYQLPVWNFWVSVQSLENQGMIENDPMYMNDAGLEMQRVSGLLALDSIWQQLEKGE